MKKNKLYGLIGKPLTHSFSKKYFTEKFEKEGIENCTFELFSLDTIQELTYLIKENPSLTGLSVTIPYKESVIPFLNRLHSTADAVGAVNCIQIIRSNNEEPELIGYNTDVFGFQQSIKPFLESQHERALILGTGGASKAVSYVLKNIGIDCYYVTRDKTKENINNSGRTFSYDKINENVIRAFKLIINTSPVGMFPNSELAPAIPYQAISAGHLLYDLVYNPAETEFLKKGKEQGASVVNGLSMPHQQAEEAWKIWNQ